MYISINEAATKFKISKRRVQVLCEQGRIRGANMVNSVWYIPDTASKPIDGRRRKTNENQISFFDITEEAFTIDDLCKVLSISKATVKNWIRLKKITPDIGDCLFSKKYIEHFISEIKADCNTKLKCRRNKKSATGKMLYKAYVHTPQNQRLVEELLELGIVQTESDLLIVLANFAIQLYYQSHGIQYTNNNVLSDFLQQEVQSKFYFLITDLLGSDTANIADIIRLQPALTKELLFVEGEDSLGFVYISLRDIGYRKNSGAYYTPEKVVKKLIDNLCNDDNQLNCKIICDPCCGTGNFLLGLGSKGIDYANLYGQDIDPVSVYLARINLALVAPKMSVLELRSRIRIGNTYFETFNEKFDIILGNPPWGSDLSDDDMVKCRNLFKTAEGKSIESYDLFVEKALSMLRYNGVLAFVLPEAVLSVAAHGTVRRLMLNSCSFKFISYLGNVFSGVQCPAIILGVTLDNAKTVIGCKVIDGNNSFVIAHGRDFSDGMLSFNISDEDNECIKAISCADNVAYLKGNAQFALGIVTGNNKEYISRQMHDGYEIVLKGRDILRYSIKETSNYIRFAPESFQQVAPTELYRAKEKLLYRFICEVPVFTYDDKQTLSLNSCNILIPQIEDLKIKYILAVLNSSVAAFFISKKFNSVKLLRSHIEALPIPMISESKQLEIIERVDGMMASSEDAAAKYADIDKLIMEAYQLNTLQRNTVRHALKGKNSFLT